MINAKGFYDLRHQAGDNYAGSQYRIEGLLHARAMQRWMSARRDGTVSVLDVGCGKAVFLLEFVNAMRKTWGVGASRLTGVDLTTSPNNRFQDLPGPFEFILQDLNETPLPLADAAFDLVFCNHVLEHVFETECLMRDICRVMAPGGMAVVSVPNLAAWINRILLLLGMQPLGTEVGTRSASYGIRPCQARQHLERFTPAGHIRDFTPLALADMARTCGLHAVGWWNQDDRAIFRVTPRSGRAVGVLLIKPASLAPPLPTESRRTA